MIFSFFLNAIVCSFLLKCCFSTTITLDNSSLQDVAVVDSHFLSFAIDSHQMAIHWKTFDIMDRRLSYLVSQLTPAYLRVGGTAADKIQFVPSARYQERGTRSNSSSASHGSPMLSQASEYIKNVEAACEKPDSQCLVYGEDILKLKHLTESSGVDLIYDLNVLQRTESHTWDPTNALLLMTFMENHKIKVSGWELGNEPDSFNHTFHTPLKAQALAKSFIKLKKIIGEFKSYRKSLIIGPDTTRPRNSRSVNYLKQFLKTLARHKEAVDAVTIHQYYFGGLNATIDDFLNPSIMDVLTKQIKTAQKAKNQYLPTSALWLGETSSAYHGGADGMSDRFVATFQWLDKLGQCAANNVQVVIKQSLIGGTYGLITPEMLPTPSYFVSILHKRLVGRKVLKFQSFGLPETVRLYVHCANERFRKGAIVIYGVNVGKTTETIRIDNIGTPLILEYLITATNLKSKFAYLNKSILKMKNNSLPYMGPSKGRNPIVIPRLSLGFWVLPDSQVLLCM